MTFLKQVQILLEAEDITILELIRTLNEARLTAVLYARDGSEVGPDHGTRIKAVRALLEVQQAAVLGKSGARKQAEEEAKGPIDINAMVEEQAKVRGLPGLPGHDQLPKA